MIIPVDSLNPDTLRAVVLEYVTRDGTENTDADVMAERVLRGLHAGKLVLTFDAEDGSTSIHRAEDVSYDDA